MYFSLVSIARIVVGVHFPERLEGTFFSFSSLAIDVIDLPLSASEKTQRTHSASCSLMENTPSLTLYP